MGDGSTGPGAGGRPSPGQIVETVVAAGRFRRGLARLLVRGADAVTRWVVRLLGAGQVAGRTQYSAAELRDLVKHTVALDGEGRRLIDEVIAAGDRHVRELMVPRTEVVFLDAAAPLPEAVRLVRQARHSRFPVIDGTHDDVVGFVHLRDLLIRPDGDGVVTVGELARPLRSLPASKRVLPALSEMRREGDHLALVVDEYGGTAGIVSLEDLIEELVGEITDEYDATPADDATPSEVDGMLNLNDFTERTGIVLPAGPYGTVGGYVMAALGRIGALGDEVVVATPDGPWRLLVVAVDGRRVARVAVTAAPEPAPEPTPEPVPGPVATELVAPRGDLDERLPARTATAR